MGGSFGGAVIVAAALMEAAAVAAAAPPARTLPMDPVELVAGRETVGKQELEIEHEGIAYRFATEENRAAFAKEPGRWAVVDGGACGRMGPLSGMGDARRFAVHASRIYLFASDGCRASFLKEPAAYIESDDEKLFGSNEQVLAGRATMDRFVSWAGGVERIKGLKRFRATAERTEKQGGNDWKVTNETAIDFGGRYFQREAWNESWFSTLSTPEGGAMATSKGAERIGDSRTRAFVRTMARWPVVMLHAYVCGASGADCPGLIVIGDGAGTVEGVEVDYVKVWLNGAASRLAVEKGTGRPVSISFTGRDGTMRLGASVRTYTANKTVDGLTLPTSYTVKFDGKDAASSAGRVDVFEVNPEFDTAKWAIPAGKQ